VKGKADRFLEVHVRNHRLSGYRDWIDLDFAERERTPESTMALGVQSAGCGTVAVEYRRITRYAGCPAESQSDPDWMQKADLRSEPGQSLNQVRSKRQLFRSTPAILAVRRCKPADEQPASHPPLFHDHDLSPISSSANCDKNSVLKSPSFTLTVLNITKQRCNELGSDFRCVATEIVTPSNGLSEN